MDFRNRIFGGYLWPVLLLFCALSSLAWIMPYPGLIATKLFIGFVATGLVWLIWSLTRRTNIALARFVSAIEHRDLAQSFRRPRQGSGFAELDASLDDALARLRHELLAKTAENRFAAALVDESPTPLLAIGPAGTVTLANKAARRLFPAGDGRKTSEFIKYGKGFAAALARPAPGRRENCLIVIDRLAQRAILSAATVDQDGERWRIVAVQIIQSELDAAELATQTGLVRVLTHEIMNSITPVMSLAATAERLVAELDENDDPVVADARLALAALSRRAADIAHFTETYRDFIEFPNVSLSRFAVRPWLEELVRSFAAMPAGSDVEVVVNVATDVSEMLGDAGLLGQVVLNLLKNAGEAAKSFTHKPRVEVAIAQSDSSRVRITVSDNGPGIAAAAADDIFLPFFTTKSSGTGVGLSYARQIVLLHNGMIGIADHGEGAAMEIVI